MPNVLILSAGTRCKVVRYFREALVERGRIVAADASTLAPALYDADAWHIVPRLDDPSYLESVLGICESEQIHGVLSLIDPELSVLAAHEAEFAAVGTTVVGSPYEACELALDKMAMCRWLTSRDYRCARSWDDLGEALSAIEEGSLAFPVFVKPVRGSASIAISKVYDRATLELLWSHSDGLMVQELLDGREAGVDAYVDMVSGEVVSVFAKWKLRMRAGETDKAESFVDERLFGLVTRLCGEAGYRGPVDVDLFEVDGEWYVSEVNPRFGGGYPFSHECGCDHVAMVVENLLGRANAARVGAYEAGVQMAKWSDLRRVV